MLVFNPLEWLPGRTQVLKDIEEYLGLAAELYEKVQKNYTNMAGVSDGWARALLEGLLSLYILQVRINLSTTSVANKAVMLPLHPLHLCASVTYVFVLPASLGLSDREAPTIPLATPVIFPTILSEIKPTEKETNTRAGC